MRLFKNLKDIKHIKWFITWYGVISESTYDLWYRMTKFNTDSNGNRFIDNAGTLGSTNDGAMQTGNALDAGATVSIPFTDGTNVVYFDGADVVQEVVTTDPYGPELITTATTANNTVGGATISLDLGIGYYDLDVTSVGTEHRYPRVATNASVALTVGKTYRYYYDYVTHSGTVDYVFYHNGGYGVDQHLVGSGSVEEIFTATVATTNLHNWYDGRNLFSLSVTNISLKEVF